MNKDVLFTIYEIVHRDLTKQLNDEYFKKLTVHSINTIYTSAATTFVDYITINYNFRVLPKFYNHRPPNYRLDVYTKYGKIRCTVSKNY